MKSEFLKKGSKSMLDKKTWWDIAATAGIATSAALFIASAELSVPVLATVGAVGAAATGIARIGAEYVKK